MVLTRWAICRSARSRSPRAMPAAIWRMPPRRSAPRASRLCRTWCSRSDRSLAWQRCACWSNVRMRSTRRIRQKGSSPARMWACPPRATGLSTASPASMGASNSATFPQASCRSSRRSLGSHGRAQEWISTFVPTRSSNRPSFLTFPPAPARTSSSPSPER